METDEPARHPDDIRDEYELKYIAELYFNRFIAGTYPSIVDEWVMDRIRRRYVKAILTESPLVVYAITKWYLTMVAFKGHKREDIIG